MAGQIRNREAFLSNLSTLLGRKEMPKTIEKPEWPSIKNFEKATMAELISRLKNQCKNINTTVVEATRHTLPQTVHHLLTELNATTMVKWDDPRFDDYQLNGVLKSTESLSITTWNNQQEAVMNIENAEKADVGITFSDITLAESATVVLLSSPTKGRSVSLLPTTYIAIIPVSTIVPRLTQATDHINNMITNGEKVPSCINFISGPSNSGDIEMDLVVGVHGPIQVVYMLVKD